MSFIRSRKSITKWNIFFHFFSIIISIINGLVIVPFYLKYIDPSLLGAWLATGNILVWLTIIEPGVGDVLQQKISSSYGSKEFKEIGMYISSGIIISFFISMIVIILSLFVQQFINQILDLSLSIDSMQLHKAFSVTAVGTGLIMFSYAFTGANQGLQSSIGIGLIFVFVNIAAVFLNLFLLIRGHGLMSIAYANLVRGAGMCAGNALYLAYRLRKQQIKLQFSKTFFFSFSKLFSFTFLSKISTSVVNNIDLILVARFVNPEMVTMLEFTRRPIKTIQGFTDRISVAFMPSLASLKGEGNIERIKFLFIQFIYIFSFASWFIIFGSITFNENFLKLWAGKSIFIGNKLNMLICFSLLISSITYNISNFTFALGDIKGNSIIAILKSIIYVILAFVLGYYFGVFGIILAIILSVLLSEVWYYPQKISILLKISKVEWKPVLLENLKIAIIGLFVTTLFFVTKSDAQNWLSLIIQTLIFSILYLVLSYISSKQMQGFAIQVYNKFIHQKSK